MKKERPLVPKQENKDIQVYGIDSLKQQITSSIQDALPLLKTLEFQVVEAPAETGFDYGVNLTKTASTFGYEATDLTRVVAEQIGISTTNSFEHVEPTGPFLNFKVDIRKFGHEVLSQISDLGPHYGKENIGEGQVVVVDMSSPNIAKRMHVAHLRSTIIGDALANLYRIKGYEVIRDNHLGDWGTGFGKLMVALNRWGNEEKLLRSKDPLGGLQRLYVKFDSEAEKEKKSLWENAKAAALEQGYDVIPGLPGAVEEVGQEIMLRKQINREDLDPIKVLEDALDRVVKSDLEKEGRNWFLKLEQGDPEARRLWKLCVDLSIKEFNRMYKILGVGFEKTLGESFYEDQLQGVIEAAKKAKASKISQGAVVIDLEKDGLGVAMIQKSDGASLYMTRDLACAIYRQTQMGADKIIYVVGADQKQYFQQLFAVLRRMKYKIGESSEHVYFGMVRNKDGKFSTRKGNVILLKDVVAEALTREEAIIRQKNPKLANDNTLRKTIVRQVAIGALKWNDLSQDPKKEVTFDWNKVLKLDGYSSPYVQYTVVRANSMLAAAGFSKDELNISNTVLPNESFRQSEERSLLRILSEYPNVLSEALRSNNPSKVAIYVYEVAKRFNAFYAHVPVLKSESDSLKKSRLLLAAACVQVTTNALGILGIEVPNEM